MDLKALAQQILYGTSIADKLTPIRLGDHDAHWSDGNRSLPRYPGRPSGLELGAQKSQKQAFPSEKTMHLPEVRGRVMHYFANHELLALELMALALLKFPTAPAGFRRMIALTMRDEQNHLRLYLDRMEALGVGFGDVPVSDFFWHALAAMKSPRHYLAGMSLTLEQANLDFSAHFLKVFNQVEDKISAGILHSVYEDEITHVAHGIKWFSRIEGRPLTFESYQNYLELPLTPARGRGRSWDEDGRKRAGFEPEFLTQTKLYSDDRSRKPRLFVLNLDAEEEWACDLSADAKPYRPKPWQRRLHSDLQLLALALTLPGDRVWVEQRPGDDDLLKMQALGFAIPRFVTEVPDDVARWRPWAVTPSLRDLAEARGVKLGPCLPPGDKCSVPPLRQLLRAEGHLDDDRPGVDGAVVSSMAQAQAYADKVRAELGLGVVIKPAYSSAGRGHIRFEASPWSIQPLSCQQLTRAFTSQRRFLIEPLWTRIRDYSLVCDTLGSKDRWHVATTLITRQGQYLGQQLTGTQDRFATKLRLIGFRVKSWLEKQGYEGPFSIDSYTYQRPGVECGWQPVSEVNQRMTMGLIGHRLARRVKPGVESIFLLATEKILAALGVERATLEERYPLVWDQGQNKWVSGCLVVGNPQTFSHHLPLLAVGPELCQSILATMSSSPYQDGFES